jgi:DNA polymerase-3 subunit gamma/tau
VQLPQHRVDQVAAQSQQLGAAALVRAIETLGSALVDMRHAPDPRILVEVALVQLTHDDVASDLGALAARLERLEQTVKAGAGAPTPGQSPGPAPVDPGTGRAVLGARAQRPTLAPDASSAPAAPPPASPDAPSPSEPSRVAAAGTTVPEAWEATVKSALKPFVRALYSAGSFTGNDGATWHFSVPNAAHGKKCAEHRTDVEAALSAAVGTPITIVIGEGAHDDPDHSAPVARATPATDASSGSARAAPEASLSDPGDDVAGAPPSAVTDEPVDPDELTDAPPDTVLTPIDRLAQAFPGSELVADDRD